MPITYNGVGTHYYGKSNVQIRPGTCRSCGRNVQLESYDTRLWFVILFIPIIPLGRKRILDSCPACRRHYVSDLEKWETARQLETSGAMDKYRSNPTPENAVAAHQQLLGFHQIEEATEFQKTMLEKFPDNAKIHAYLGSALEHIGRREQAAASYKRALELRPDLPEARIGIARGYMRDGRLDDARKMLDFLEKSGSAQLYSLEPLETLAHVYQSGGRHQEALDIFEIMLRELPKIAEHPLFRKAVKKSEKALNRDRSILPAQKFSLKRIFQTGGRGGRPIASARGLLLLGATAAIVMLGFGISNEYIRRHRKLYLVNGYDTPATVEISGGGAVKNFKGLRTLDLPEGHFHAVITGPVRQELDFDVSDSYFNRWFEDPLWLINVGGGALLELRVATYSRDPQPSTVTVHVGKTFEKFGNVTHPFTPLPESVQIQSGGSRTLVQLDLSKADASDAFAYYEQKRGPNEALTFAEAWLGAHQDDETILAAYAGTAVKQKQQKRLDAFLRSGLTNRPVQISWHRVYQNLHDHEPEHAALVRDYDGLLSADPTNSALLYLRGRLEANRNLARDYFQRAADGDPNNPFPFFALGYDRMAAADWAGAKTFFAHAAELNSHDLAFASILFTARLALGEAPALEEESRKKLVGDPLDYFVEVQLVDALAAQHKFAEALKVSSSFVTLCQNRYGPSAKALMNAAEYHTYYAVGDFDKLKSAASNDPTAAGKNVLAMALVEQGMVDEAVKALPSDADIEERSLFCLALAAAYRQNHNETSAVQWRSRGIEILEQGNEDAIQAAALLRRSTPPTRAEAEGVIVQPELKAVILVLLSQEHPQARAELTRFAGELNVARGFPYHLVQRIAANMP